MRDGRSFRTRRVLAQQSTGEMLTVICSFHLDEPGPLHVAHQGERLGALALLRAYAGKDV